MTPITLPLISADAINKGWFSGTDCPHERQDHHAVRGPIQAHPARARPFWLHEDIDADNKDEIRKAVRQNIYYGADLIKLVTETALSSLFGRGNPSCG